MWNKTFNTNTTFEVVNCKTGEFIGITKTKKEARNLIYSYGQRNQKYSVLELTNRKEVCYKFAGEKGIINEWIMNFKKEGPIFEKKWYSLLDELKSEAQRLQLTYNLDV